MIHFFNNQFVRFIVTGGFAAGANFVSRIGFGYYVSYATSIILAQLFGMVVAYVLFKTVVFAPSLHSTRKQLSYFALINVVGLLMILSISVFCYHEVFAPSYQGAQAQSVSHFIGISLTTVTSYFGHKYLTFK